MTLPKDNVFYVVYRGESSKGETVTGIEQSNNATLPFKTDEFVWYEKFLTKKEFVEETWQLIKNKHTQGLLRRAFSTDFEKHYPDGKVEIHISIVAHC